jgi:hypothetical protein
MSLSVRKAALALCCLGLTVSGCSASVSVTKDDPSITKESLQSGISDVLQQKVGQRPDSVECPGPIKAKAGETARCVLSAGNVRCGLTATVNSYADGKANYSVQVDSKPAP